MNSRSSTSNRDREEEQEGAAASGLYLMKNSEMYSLRDLVETQTGELARFLRAVVERLATHIVRKVS